MLSNKHAVAFPGQGAHNALMLEKYKSMPEFASHYDAVCNALGFSPLKRFETDKSAVNTNKISSLLTVLASKLSYLRYLDTGARPDYLAGYSVGQYSALNAAGCFSFDALVTIVARRAQLMDSCFGTTQGSMMGIIGVSQQAVEELVDQMRSEGCKIWISNYNCFGQYSLSGERTAIEVALQRAEALDPKVVVELPVGGAWHCPLLEGAAQDFQSFLLAQEWNLPSSPVINNVSGDFMPESVDAIKEELVKHLYSPVYWEKGVRTLIASGCNSLTEVGYGNVLTKFGFFIDRKQSFKAFSGEVQPVCAE